MHFCVFCRIYSIMMNYHITPNQRLKKVGKCTLWYPYDQIPGFQSAEKLNSGEFLLSSALLGITEGRISLCDHIVQVMCILKKKGLRGHFINEGMLGNHGSTMYAVWFLGPTTEQNVNVFLRHFTEDCFKNKAQ